MQMTLNEVVGFCAILFFCTLGVVIFSTVVYFGLKEIAYRLAIFDINKSSKIIDDYREAQSVR